MVFDIIVVAVLAASMVLGFRSGFVYAFIHAIGWLLAVLMGFIWSPKLCTLLIDKFALDESLYGAFYGRFSESFSVASDTLSRLPAVLSSVAEKTETTFISSIAETMSDLCLRTIAFLLTVLAAKLLLWIFTEMLSKKNRGGFAGLLDGVLGLFSGLLRGFLLIFFLLALLVPVSSFLSPETASSINDALTSSTFAIDLYDNNLLLLVVRSFLK